MILKNIKNLCIVSLMLVLSACDPIVDEQYLSNTTDVDGVELVAGQSTVGGNLITLDMVTPGVTGYWDNNLGKAYTNKVTFVYPIPGTSTFTYTGTLGAEFFTKTIEVQIDQLDNDLEQDWYDLVGDNTTAGKTWVFDGVAGDGNLWWYMCPGGDKSNWESVWWNAGGTCCPPADSAGKMHFDLDGAANYTYYADSEGEGQLSSFVLDPSNETLQINGGNILGSEERGNPDGLYEIVSLTEDELILYVPTNSGGTGWTWIFKPEVE